MWSDPASYAEMSRHFDELSAVQGPVVEAAVRSLREAFARDSFLSVTCERVDVEARCKELYAVHRKMLQLGKTKDEARRAVQAGRRL